MPCYRTRQGVAIEGKGLKSGEAAAVDRISPPQWQWGPELYETRFGASLGSFLLGLVQTWELRSHRESVSRRKGRSLGQDPAINRKSTAECKASEGEGGRWHSRILGLPLSDSLHVSSSFPCSVTLLICTDSLFYRPGPALCSTRHKGLLNSLEGTAIIRSRNCSHQMEKIEHFQSAILFLVKVPCHMKLWATAAVVLSTEKGGLFGVYFEILKTGYNFHEMRDEFSSFFIML